MLVKKEKVFFYKPFYSLNCVLTFSEDRENHPISRIIVEHLTSFRERQNSLFLIDCETVTPPASGSSLAYIL